MTLMEMFEYNAILTLLGTAVFIAIVVIVFKVMWKDDTTDKSASEERPVSTGIPFSASISVSQDNAITAAISAAVNKYRQNN